MRRTLASQVVTLRNDRSGAARTEGSDVDTTGDAEGLDDLTNLERMTSLEAHTCRSPAAVPENDAYERPIPAAGQDVSVGKLTEITSGFKPRSSKTMYSELTIASEHC